MVIRSLVRMAAMMMTKRHAKALQLQEKPAH